MASRNEITPLVPTDYGIAAAYGRALGDFAAARGMAVEPVARAYGVDPKDLSKLDRRINIDSLGRLFDRFTTLSGDPGFVAAYAQAFPLGGGGPLDYGVLHARSVRAALDFLVKHAAANVDLTLVQLEIDQNEARLCWTFSPLLVRAAPVSEFLAALIVRMLRSMLGARWRAVALELEHGDRRAERALRALAARRLIYEAEINSLNFCLRDLSVENPKHDPVLCEIMRDCCADALTRRDRSADLAWRVREEVLSALAYGPVTVDRIASRVGLSVRSLQRRLSEQGRSFNDLVDETRRALSTRLLRETELPISEISRRLGFSAPGSYTRSATRWYGQSPSAVRGA